MMFHVFANESKRATYDVDLAVAVPDWDSFRVLQDALVGTGDFVLSQDTGHLLHYRPAEHGRAYPLDLIPFGGVETLPQQIAWPPDMSVVMNVTGYAEALDSAVEVDLGASVCVPVVSVPALAALKLLAWNDRGLENSKDAQDLIFLLQNYHDAGNIDRLYGDAYHLLETYDFDPGPAGATLLGQDAHLILREKSRMAILGVLADPRKRDRLVIHAVPGTERDPAKAGRLLEAFERGLNFTAKATARD